MQWFRMYAEAVDDDKLRLLAFEDRWHFVAILCLKSAGVLDSDPSTLERRIAIKLGLMPKDLGEVKRRLSEAALIDDLWQPKAWGKRQYTSDSSTERTRRWRVKRHSDVPETSQQRHGDGPDTEQIQNRTEQKQSGDARTTRAPTAKRIPDDFKLTEELRAIALAEGVDAEREFARFTDYWRSASGANARKHDWEATWRNWCRKASDIRNTQSASAPKRTWRPGPEDSGPC